MQPILCFGGLFQGNMELSDEVSFAVSVLRFVNVRTNGSAAAQDLLGQDRFVLCFEKITVKLYDSRTEINGFFNQDIFFIPITTFTVSKMLFRIRKY